MTLNHAIMAIVGLLLAIYAVVKAALSGRRSSLDTEIIEQGTQEQLESIEEVKNEQVDDYKNDSDGLANSAQSTIDSLRAGDE